MDAVLDAVPLRPCTQRIPARGAHAGPCALHELRRCAPRAPGCRRSTEYAPAVAAWRRLVEGADDAPLARGRRRGRRWPTGAVRGRGRRRDRLAALVPALGRAQRLAALAALAELVGARPDGRGGWELAVVRHGRLAAAGVARRGVPPMPVVEALRTGAQTVLPGPGRCAGPAEEVGLLHRWLTGAAPGWSTATRRGPSRPAAPRAAWAEWARRGPLEVAGPPCPGSATPRRPRPRRSEPA